MAGLRNLRGVTRLEIEDNDVLTDMSPFACVEVVSEALRVVNAPALADASDLAALRSAPSVRFEGTGLSTSLVRLETLTHGDLWLHDLPLVMDLEPLSAMTDGGAVSLLRMPKVTTLHGLHNLEHVSHLMIGDCMRRGRDTRNGRAGRPLRARRAHGGKRAGRRQ